MKPLLKFEQLKNSLLKYPDVVNASAWTTGRGRAHMLGFELKGGLRYELRRDADMGSKAYIIKWNDLHSRQGIIWRGNYPTLKASQILKIVKRNGVIANV